MKSILTLLVLSSLISVGFAAPAVRVEALFKDAAYLNINGEKALLKQGQAHASGVKLLQANSHQAEVSIDGKRHTMTLHMAIGGNYQPAELVQVIIRKNQFNQYKVAGSINSLPVTFLVDTGANIVAINGGQAKKLGIQYRLYGQPSEVVTASGVVKSWGITLDSIKVGEISVSNVAAVVLEGDFPTDVLLGMSFLEHVKLSEQNSVLHLEKRY